MKFGKWLGGGIGWAFGGPLGGLIGFALGSLVDNATLEVTTYDNPNPYAQRVTRPGDFSASLLVLSAAVMKADGQILKSELEYVKTFFVRQFGVDRTREQMLILRELIKKEIPLREVCGQIRMHMDLASRLQLIHFLFGISRADGQVHHNETIVIENIANFLDISQPDFNAIKAMFYRDTDSDYKILEVTPQVSDEELKKAYRRMAVKFHPDKVSHLGEDVQHAAKEKFQQVQQAYENIKKVRNLK